MKYIVSNSVIRSISQPDYIKEFGVTFKQSRDRDSLNLHESSASVADLAERAPWPDDNLATVINEQVASLNPGELQTLMDAQTNDRYRNAIRARATKMEALAA